MFFALYATRSMRFQAFWRPNQKRSEQRMTHRSENLQPSLFEAERPCVELRAAQKSELAIIIEVLLREIAAALAKAASGRAAMTKITAEHLARSACVYI